MEEKVKCIENLSNEDLLSLYSAVVDHLTYLEDSLLSLDEEKEEESEDGDNNES